MSCMLEAARERPPHLEAGALDGVVRGHGAQRRAGPTVVAGSGRAMRGSTSGLSTVTAGMAASWRSRLVAVACSNLVALATIPAERRRSRPRRRPGHGESRPRRTRRPFHAGVSVASSRSGNRRISVPRAMRPSSRASAAPRQWWIPDPNARCWAAPGRVEVERCGVVTPLGRVAVGRRQARQHEHAGARWCWSPTLDVGRRDPTRELHRRSRSAAARRPRWRRATGRRATVRAARGCGAARSVPLPMRLTVVSCPAMYSRITWSRSSSGERRSPSSSAAMSAESRSSAGWVRFHSMASSTCSMMWSDASTISSRCCSASSGSRPSVSVCAQLAQLRLLRHRHAEHRRRSPGTAAGTRGRRSRRLGPSSAPRDDGVERLVDHRLHPGRQLLDHPGREHLLHQPRGAGVVGRVEVEDLRVPRSGRSPRICSRISARGLRADHAAVLDAQRRVAQEPDGVVVAEQRPQPERRAAAPGWLAQSSAYCGYGSSAKPGSNGLKQV